MANQKKTMNEVKQVLRLHYERGIAIMTIARELRMSKNTVKEYLRRFEKSGVSLTSVLNQHQTDFWY
jgi:transposase